MRPRYEEKQPFDKLRANGKDKRRLCRPNQFGNIAREGATMAGLGQKFERHRPLLGKLLFEIVIIFVGVTAAFALEAARQDRQDNDYRESMIAALIPTLCKSCPWPVTWPTSGFVSSRSSSQPRVMRAG